MESFKDVYAGLIDISLPPGATVLGFSARAGLSQGDGLRRQFFLEASQALPILMSSPEAADVIDTMKVHRIRLTKDEGLRSWEPSASPVTPGQATIPSRPRCIVDRNSRTVIASPCTLSATTKHSKTELLNLSRRNEMAPAKSQQPAPPGFSRRFELDISSWSGRELVLDTNHRVQCFLGYRRDDQPHNLSWYAPSVALRDRDGRTSYRFVELRRGVLRQSSLLRDDEYYKVIDNRYVSLPRGTSSYFGVVCADDKSEDEELTRQVFGGTMQEFGSVAYALAHTVGRSLHTALRLPRLTFSKRENRCEVSGCLIPENFPYLAFDDARYDFSHVSLYGLYRMLSFMCPPGESPVTSALEDAGVSVELIRRFVANGLNANPIYPRGLDL